MTPSDRGVSEVEVVVTIVILGVLAAVVVPSYFAMVNRAKEGSTKSNMRAVQLAVEDYGIQNDAMYPSTMDESHLADQLPLTFKNPFTGKRGAGIAWEDREFFAADPSATPGIVSYADSSANLYNVKGYGTAGPIDLVLSSGP